MLTQKNLTQERKLKLRWLVAMSSLPLLGVLTAFGIMPQTEINPVTSRSVVEEIPMPQVMVPAAGSAVTTAFWRNERVQRGDTVAELLRRLNVEDVAASEYLRNDSAAESFRQLVEGKSVQAETGADGSLLALRYLSNGGEQVAIERGGESFKVTVLPAQLEARLFMRTGIVNSTLFGATDEAGLPDSVASQMAEIFGGDIDFHRDLRRGDKFSVVYEMVYSNGEPVRAGRIQAAEFVSQGKAYRAVYFQEEGGRGDYYTPDGKSVRKTFLRSPMEFSRVSSGFSSSRYHPVLKEWRSHKGVDYAAPTGTRVRVTGDGVVSFVGKQGGYGNVIMVEHQGRYTTVYGHLSRFAKGLHRGQRVQQGEIIGYVGMTGLATGPHLHYEFKIGGQQRDPLRVALPSATPVSMAQKAAFEKSTTSLIERLGLLHDVSLAKLD